VTKFLVKQSDASFEARFAFPAFALTASAPSLHQNMLLSLGKYGLTLNDIRVEAGLPNLSGANATYSLSTLNAFVRVWLNRLEVFFGDPTRVREEQFLEITRIALDTMQHTVQDLRMETYTATLNMHGTLPDIEVSQFLTLYVPTTPEGLGMVVGRAVGYYFGPEAERLSASLIVDMSSVIPEAIFVRASVVFDGAKLPLDRGLSAAREYAFKMLAEISLEPS
jgi:hypothetical protein